MIVCNVICGSIVHDLYIMCIRAGKHKKKNKKEKNMENHAMHIRLFDMEIHFRYDKCVRELNTWLQANKYFDIYMYSPLIFVHECAHFLH